ncbi:BamA/TamA family outer membrane protein [Pedobacter jamesrossensis]|uniref:BamA/TamA family outer membrane protein n=1 Tax=Pedobacter jamesrossensis TaxID=1908238 RepID=A0ABV8NK92_9SPHI
MKKSIFFFLAFCISFSGLNTVAQNKIDFPDSVNVRIMPRYDSVSRMHRKIFGENYRKEYAMQTRLPIIRLSQISGGLTAFQKGGGNQTRSVRLHDASGNEWSLRSVEKFPEVLLPAGLRETFLATVIKDNMSAQHPFSALIVPPLTEAIGAPHSSPVIGYVAPDQGLGEFTKEFASTVCLLEIREPIGKSDNSEKMLQRLRSTEEITYNSELYLKLKCLDVLIGDWDRHEDQWRWKALKGPGGARYTPIPRDRDQVFYRSDGKIQRAAQSSWFLPMMQGYERNLQNINWFLWEGREINTKLFSEMSKDTWDRVVREFCIQMSDELLEVALKKLPRDAYLLRHDQLFSQLQQRRSTLPEMMDKYYLFFNRIVDIELSDKSEKIQISDVAGNGIKVIVTQNEKDGGIEPIYNRTFDPMVTKEIRLYLHGGVDAVSLDNKTSSIKIRIIAEKDAKDLNISQSKISPDLYAHKDQLTIHGQDSHKLNTHLSNDSANVAYLAKDLYSRHYIFPILGYNNDDGIAAGLTFKITSPGFRKTPYGNSQSFSFLYSFGSSAFNFRYNGDWIHAIGKADFVVEANASAPMNSQNFYGLGNQTPYDDDLDDIYYRARFNLYELSPALRWRLKKTTFSVGPTFQYYNYDKDGNQGRLISMTNQLHSSDSTTIAQNKAFAGVILKYILDTRDRSILPTKGVLLDTRLTAYEGLNSYSNTFGQFNAEMSFHQRLDSAAHFVLTDRIGGGISAGKPAFYQEQFLGGQGNLLGYHEYRFAGEQSLFNNLELKAKLGSLISYVLPGEIGLLGIYDIGRVWKRNEDSRQWHQSVGGGIYFAPASLSLIKIVASYSKEGWYPYFTLSFRY